MGALPEVLPGAGEEPQALFHLAEGVVFLQEEERLAAVLRAVQQQGAVSHSRRLLVWQTSTSGSVLLVVGFALAVAVAARQGEAL